MAEGGSAAAAAATVKSPGDGQLWTAWHGLRRSFPVWSFGMTGFRQRETWGLWGNDLVSGLRRSEASRAAGRLLADASPALMTALRELAEVNVRRHEHMFRFYALGYLTLPLGAGALAAELAPDFLQAIYADSPSRVWGLVFVLAIGVYLAFVGLWRARQMTSVLDLLAAEQALARAPAGDQPSSLAALGAK